MASWQLVISGSKSAVATQLGSASISQATSMDSPPQVLSGITGLAPHFAAAVASAQGQLTALTGLAPNARVAMTGYLDTDTAAPIPATGASRINVLVSEFWS